MIEEKVVDLKYRKLQKVIQKSIREGNYKYRENTNLNDIAILNEFGMLYHILYEIEDIHDIKKETGMTLDEWFKYALQTAVEQFNKVAIQTIIAFLKDERNKKKLKDIDTCSIILEAIRRIQQQLEIDAPAVTAFGEFDERKTLEEIKFALDSFFN